MCKGTEKGWPARLPAIFVAALVIGCGNQYDLRKIDASDRFETTRAYIQTWLSKASADSMIISSPRLKATIVDDWDNQKANYQIVSVRNPDDYDTAGHIPNVINIYWVDIVTDENLARLDSSKILILYCYYGHASMISGTILSLLGYKCRSLDFGMMTWNMDALVKAAWDQEAGYEVESDLNKPTEPHAPPIIKSSQGEARAIIKEMARKYFAGEGSPVITSSDVKAIVDNWNRRGAEFQIVDARSKSDYESGHIPHSINIPWASIAESENLRHLDPKRTSIVYSENGQTGQLATTVLSLLGYKAVNMKFGMMDWNKLLVDSSQLWQGAAGYPIERSTRDAVVR
ncbi:MAG: hypothetical protein A2W25_02495 [candidate division Zixibacteria bacterium RBG_16_53_22]|nr:MAG: hypothetical protein A2W25_02495 [candidate division Zixibacteria bacterium RBG_16_53_22]